MKWVVSISRDYWVYFDITLQSFKIWEFWGEFWGIKTLYWSKFSPATGVSVWETQRAFDSDQRNKQNVVPRMVLASSCAWSTRTTCSRPRAARTSRDEKAYQDTQDDYDAFFRCNERTQTYYQYHFRCTELTMTACAPVLLHSDMETRKYIDPCRHLEHPTRTCLHCALQTYNAHTAKKMHTLSSPHLTRYFTQ